MSRIDEALRRAEGEPAEAAPGTPDAAAGRAGGHGAPRTALADYVPESSAPPRALPPLTAVVRTPATNPEPPAARPATAGPTPAPSSMTPTADPVSDATTAPGRRPRHRAVLGGAWAGRLVTEPNATLVCIEQYRRLAAALHDVQVERGLKTLMITSTVPGEGKTLTVANLGLTLASSYARRVLLIDGDLRWPSLHDVFGVRNDVGVAEVLTGAASSVPLVPVGDSLSLLAAGHPGVNPLAGLTSERMAALLSECGEQFDWVLIDTPPVGLLPDAQLLARLTRSVVFVIAAGSTPSALVERAVAELGPDCVIGTVLNQVEEYTVPEVNYYRDYYGYGSVRPNVALATAEEQVS